MGYTVRNPDPTTPKPLIFPNSRKPTKKERKEHIEYCISFYKKRFNRLAEEEPLIFKKKWIIKMESIRTKISDLEYELLKYTQPKIIKEVEEAARGE